jgi:hypothetical protein
MAMDFLQVLHDNLPLAQQLVTAFALGMLVAMQHALSSWLNGRPFDRPFMTTLILLAIVIALVTVVIGDNLARAFGLAGSLAIVRFRTVVEDTRDTAFVIFAVVSGMAAGAGGAFWIGPILCTPLVLMTIFLLRSVNWKATITGTLVVRLVAGKPPEPVIEELIRQHTRVFRARGVSTARNGSAYDLAYYVQLPHAEHFFVLVTELSRVEGVQSVELKDN